MEDKTIDAIIGTPDEHDGFSVQLFVKDGAQWGDIYRENGVYVLELPYGPPGKISKFPVEEVLHVLESSLAELRSRNEGT
jgi:hypothetical protein